MYDLVLKGGHLIDPGQDIDEYVDIAISSDKVSAIEGDIPKSQARDVVDLTGKLVTPGLVDIHTHIYWGFNELSVEVDSSCLSRGVTTAVDAGSPGALTFAGFRRYIIEASETRVFAFLALNPIGNAEWPVSRRPRYELVFGDLERPTRVLRENSDVILGVKVLMSQHYTGDSGIQPLWLARFLADKVRSRLVVHIGNSDVSLSEILALMRGGDILSHCFNGYVNGILDWDGKVLSAVREAVDRGVVLDVGHGSSSFSFEVARLGLAQGLRPVISTDLQSKSIRGPVYDLPTTMSKFLALGLSLEEVVKATTVDAAAAIGREDEFGSLHVGKTADVTAFDVSEGEFEFRDSHDAPLTGTRKLVPVLTIREGKVVMRTEALQ